MYFCVFFSCFCVVIYKEKKKEEKRNWSNWNFFVLWIYFVYEYLKYIVFIYVYCIGNFSFRCILYDNLFFLKWVNVYIWCIKKDVLFFFSGILVF